MINIFRNFPNEKFVSLKKNAAANWIENKNVICEKFKVFLDFLKATASFPYTSTNENVD